MRTIRGSRVTRQNMHKSVENTQQIVEATWLFDTGTGAHVMPKHVWEQLGEVELQPTSVSL